MQVQALMTNAERYSLSAAVFTALTDVELEIDGLMSYDRAVIKMGAQPLHQIHTQLIQASHMLNQGPVGETRPPPPASLLASQQHHQCDTTTVTIHCMVQSACGPQLPVALTCYGCTCLVSIMHCICIVSTTWTTPLPMSTTVYFAS